ncbi:ABC transporter substrate-binding protein [Trinickia dinghuensis]|uniref:Sugar ABC transporter substrate-binding protein n=1 Tax=Trinickia dinghuensis TaxID=2291023 RepID=A0A3D8JVA1_9BURK|nr:sugar ABC transporter substrate-binding protein [Trinickia dinghuensis]RDU96722.1 sugar ABC transporter substrate-binding protein [Trinickia dinghuensis]
MPKKLLIAGAVCALAGAYAHADTTIKLVEVLTSPERTETLQGLVASFEKNNPGTHVEITSLPWGQAFEKFATMVSAGDSPDVVEMPDRWLSLYAGNHELESLEPYLAKWNATADLNARALESARNVNKTAYVLPYGFYLRALFYNKVLFKQAGIAEPPRTTDEFVADAKRISALPGKYGYCLRGGTGATTSWMMFGATAGGSNTFFTADGKSTLADPAWVKGTTWFANLYKQGLAPKDSVNWGFNEVVAGFYSGTCAMLDQDPDSLIAIAQRMSPDQYGVAPMPTGPSGKSFPIMGFAGWSIMAASTHKPLAWKLIQTLDDPAGNLVWNKRTGALPIYKSAAKDPFYAKEQYKAWFDELDDKNQVPTMLPEDVPGYAYFDSMLVTKYGQQTLLGQISPAEMNTQWANYLTKARQKQLAGR